MGHGRITDGVELGSMLRVRQLFHFLDRGRFIEVVEEYGDV